MVSVHALWQRMHNSEPTKKWKPHWFYASGAWEFAEGDEPTLPRIPRRFRIPVELEQVELSATKQNEINQVLSLPTTERAANILLARESLIDLALMRPSRSDAAMQAQLMKLAKKGQSNGSASGS
ncbi:unnamed protein product [Prunus armeniaca]